MATGWVGLKMKPMKQYNGTGEGNIEKRNIIKLKLKLKKLKDEENNKENRKKLQKEKKESPFSPLVKGPPFFQAHGNTSSCAPMGFLEQPRKPICGIYLRHPFRGIEP